MTDQKKTTKNQKNKLQYSNYLIINIWSIKDSQIPDHRERYIAKPSLN